MRTSYDLIVVGGGPSGCTAARYAAVGGASVLVLEKDREIGIPVRCAEAVNQSGLIQFMQPDPKFIAATVTKFKMVAPNGKVVQPVLEGVGYVLERRIFDAEVARLAAMEGAEIVTKAYVYDLLKSNGKIEGVKALIKGERVEIHSRIVIGADGVESRVGRWAGITTNPSIQDLESCAQMTLGGIEVEPDALYFYLGQDYSPGGYLWVFPKGKNMANVGVGISVDVAKKKSAISYLNDFIKKKYPHAAVIAQIAGGVPCATTVKPLVKENVMLSGDAAHQVNPLSGGGIISGMIGGMLAGQTAANAIKSNSLDRLQEYEDLWQKRLGNRHESFYNIKSVINFEDKILNKIADDVLQIPDEKRTMGAILKSAMWNKPSILLDVAKVYLI
jgi:digeranylgeranylglycerophospholipid reductase